MSGNSRLKRKVFEGVPNRTIAPSVYFYSCQTRPLHTTITPPATSLKPASIRRRRDYVHANSRRKSSASNLLIPNHKLRHLASPTGSSASCACASEWSSGRSLCQQGCGALSLVRSSAVSSPDRQLNSGPRVSGTAEK